jgi:hypothetical protein
MGQPGSGENKECYDMVMNALKVWSTERLDLHVLL